MNKIYFNLLGIDLPTKNYLSGSFCIQVRTDDITITQVFHTFKARSPLGRGAGGVLGSAQQSWLYLTHKLRFKSQIVNLRFLDNGFALLLPILLDFKLDIKVMDMINYIPCQNL